MRSICARAPAERDLLRTFQTASSALSMDELSVRGACQEKVNMMAFRSTMQRIVWPAALACALFGASTASAAADSAEQFLPPWSHGGRSAHDLFFVFSQGAVRAAGTAPERSCRP